MSYRSRITLLLLLLTAPLANGIASQNSDGTPVSDPEQYLIENPDGTITITDTAPLLGEDQTGQDFGFDFTSETEPGGADVLDQLPTTNSEPAPGGDLSGLGEEDLTGTILSQQQPVSFTSGVDDLIAKTIMSAPSAAPVADGSTTETETTSTTTTINDELAVLSLQSGYARERNGSEDVVGPRVKEGIKCPQGSTFCRRALRVSRRLFSRAKILGLQQPSSEETDNAEDRPSLESSSTNEASSTQSASASSSSSVSSSQDESEETEEQQMFVDAVEFEEERGFLRASSMARATVNSQDR